MPADHEQRGQAPRRSRAGSCRRSAPRHSVAIQLKILIPVGTAIVNDASMKKASTTVAVGVVNMWCAQTTQAEEGDGHGGRRDRLVAEDRLAGEHRQDLRDHPERRQHHDVDLGVPEEPEQVLPQERVAATGGVEERGAVVPVGEQHRHRGRDRGQGHHQQVAEDQDRPHEQRHPAPAHARGTHVVDGRDEVDPAHQRGDAGEVDQEDPGVHAAARGVEVVRQRRVHGPAGRRRLEEEAAVEGHPAEEGQPVGERVQLGEGHVPRADHQRHQVVAEPRDERDDEQEDHRRPVHRHQAVVDLGRHQGALRLGQLEAHDQGLHAAHEQEDDRGGDVEDPDLLVVRRGQPGEPAGRWGLEAVLDDLRPGDARRCRGPRLHQLASSSASRRSRCSASSSPASWICSRWFSAQAVNSLGVTARTWARMSAWLEPQSSAHCPK